MFFQIIYVKYVRYTFLQQNAVELTLASYNSRKFTIV